MNVSSDHRGQAVFCLVSLESLVPVYSNRKNPSRVRWDDSDLDWRLLRSLTCGLGFVATTCLICPSTTLPARRQTRSKARTEHKLAKAITIGAQKPQPRISDKFYQGSVGSSIDLVRLVYDVGRQIYSRPPCP